MNSVPVSAVIISFNEENNIGRCIHSLKGVVDEIIVLDSGSGDDTVKIAESLGAKVFTHPFDGHIEQKNRAITYASNPYILSLDADEALDETLQQSIIKVKSNWTADGYTMNRSNQYCGRWMRHSGWYPDRKLRLWDSRQGRWGGINPHDRYEMDPGARIQHLNGDILHYTISDIKAHLKQLDYFTDISASEYYNKGKRTGILDLTLRPWYRFIRDYFFKGGILDGWQGFQVCIMSSFSTFLKYVKLRELEKKSCRT